jgi:hypothetical protein
MQLSIRCPDFWVYDADVDAPENETAREGSEIDIPVFGVNDLVGGTVLLNPVLMHQGKGKLSISVRVWSQSERFPWLKRG